jgi:hypothetical protein
MKICFNVMKLSLVNDVSDFIDLCWEVVSRYPYDHILINLVDVHEIKYEIYAIEESTTTHKFYFIIITRDKTMKARSIEVSCCR